MIDRRESQSLGVA